MMQNKQNIDLIVSRLMLTAGFNPQLSGVIYLREAIDYCVCCQNNCKASLSGEVYPLIAKSHASTTQRVERNIRTALQKCYNDGTLFNLNDLCGYDLISRRYPPTNGEFIAKTSEYIKTLNLQAWEYGKSESAYTR